MKMPKIIYARIDDEDSDPTLIAEDELENVVRENGDTVVGVYELKSTRTFNKVVRQIR